MRFFVAVLGVAILCFSGSPLGGTTLPSPYRPSAEVEARCGEFESEEFEPCVRALVFELVNDGSRKGLRYDAYRALVESNPPDLDEVLLDLMENGYYFNTIAAKYWSLQLNQEPDQSSRIDLLERVLLGELQYSVAARGWAARKLCGMGVPHLREPIREAYHRLHELDRQLCEAKMALAGGEPPSFGDYVEGMRTALSGEFPGLEDPSSVRSGFIAWCARGMAQEYVPEHNDEVEETVMFLRRFQDATIGFNSALHLYHAFHRRGMDEEELQQLGFIHGYFSYWHWEKYYKLPPLTEDLFER